VNSIFSLTFLKDLIETKKINEAKQYINQFFFKYLNNIFFNDKGTYILFSKEEALKLLPNDLILYDGKNIIFNAKSYLNSTEFMNNEFKITIDFKNQNKIFEKTEVIDGCEYKQKYLNMIKPLPIDINKKINRELLKDDLKMIYDHILNIWCSKNQEAYEWILNFISCSINGRKVRKYIYSQCSERCGRGTIINFLKSMLGRRMFKNSSIETITTYTKELEGCCLGNFDELPVEKSNCKSVSDSLKSLSTEPTFRCRDMYKNGYEQINTFNIIITTNNDAINLTQQNNMRAFVLDIDESYKEDKKYFTKINKITENVDIQILFYNDMIQRFKTLDNWNEDVMPLTITKQKKICEALPKIYKYVKEEYVLAGKNLDMRTTEFIEEYQKIMKIYQRKKSADV
jgi:hypothetical protein